MLRTADLCVRVESVARTRIGAIREVTNRLYQVKRSIRFTNRFDATPPGQRREKTEVRSEDRSPDRTPNRRASRLTVTPHGSRGPPGPPAWACAVRAARLPFPPHLPRRGATVEDAADERRGRRETHCLSVSLRAESQVRTQAHRATPRYKAVHRVATAARTRRKETHRPTAARTRTPRLGTRAHCAKK